MPATEVTHDTVRRVDPGDLDLTLLHNPLGERTHLRWSTTERLLLTLALCCLGGFVMVWVGW